MSNTTPAPQEERFPPIPTFHDQPVRWLLRHWYWCKRLKARGSLRCPACGVRGTWKPYGLFGWQDRLVRRWLCKWCGFYDAVDGRFWAFMDSELGTWVLAPQWQDVSYEEHQARVADGRRSVPRKMALEGKAYPKPHNPFAG